MKLSEIAQTLTTEEKKEIRDTLDSIAIESKKTDKYKGEDLAILLKYWKRINPKHTMDLTCGGCRAGMHKFFYNLSQYFQSSKFYEL